MAAAVVLRRGQGAPDAGGRDAAAVASIRAFAARRLATFKVPRKLVVVNEIPKGATGKVRRTALAEELGLAAPRRAGGERTGPRPPE